MNMTQSVNQGIRQAQFSAALLKVASRCNLNCDYCYVYHHADQSWRTQPRFMSNETLRQFGSQLNAYVSEREMDLFSIIFHGGEPLLFTADRLSEASDIIRAEVVSACELDFSIQTNGVLLTDAALGVLESARIGVSLSLDGPKDVNDLHRLDHGGKSSYESTFEALQRLIGTSSGVFQGVLAVIDPSVPADRMLKFFSQFDIPRLDLLLPDATHVNPHFDEKSKIVFQAWLNEAFELWYKEYSDLPIRFFDAILGSRLSVPSSTDVMGFGTVSLIVIETDGSYTDHDVFKITEEGKNHLQRNVSSDSFESLATLPAIREHNRRLSLEGVAIECRSCPVLEACGGGSVMHRYHAERGFDAPSVYCGEMFSVLSTATRLLRADLGESSDIDALTQPASYLSFPEDFVDRCKEWRAATERRANDLARQSGLHFRDDIPAAALHLRSSFASASIMYANGFAYEKPQDSWLEAIRLQTDEPWLTKPFADTIHVHSTNADQYKHGKAMLDLAEMYLSEFSPFLPLALRELVSDVLFVEAKDDKDQGIFSFSDDSAPNVLYISPYAGSQPLTPDDIADSILHEFLHQVLYHIELGHPLLFDHDYPTFPAPWRSGFRPAGGFLHGTYVFSGLALFWEAIASSDASKLPMYDKDKAVENARRFRAQAAYGVKSAYQFSLLTPAGQRFVKEIANQLGIASLEMDAPGILK